jgi:hypothetical protein
LHCRFEGLYFKQQSGENMIAFIPALHTDSRGKRAASLQVVTPDMSHFVELPGGSVRIDRRTMTASAEGGVFGPDGIEIELDRPGLRVAGRLRFSRRVPPRGDIMGPYRFVPFMECRHSVFSLSHDVRGSLTVNGARLDFPDGVGYIEGDRGRSFPERYVWTQCSRAAPERCSLMLSAATVRPLGREFTGIIGFVYFRGREYRIATYRGARLRGIENGAVTVCQGPYELRAQLLSDSAHTLSAPVSGKMVRSIREGLACRAAYRFTESGSVLFDFMDDRASFEYEF